MLRLTRIRLRRAGRGSKSATAESVGGWGTPKKVRGNAFGKLGVTPVEILA